MAKALSPRNPVSHPDHERFIAALEQLRIQARHNLARAERHCGIRRGAWSNIRRGAYLPYWPTVACILNAYQVPRAAQEQIRAWHEAVRSTRQPNTPTARALTFFSCKFRGCDTKGQNRTGHPPKNWQTMVCADGQQRLFCGHHRPEDCRQQSNWKHQKRQKNSAESWGEYDAYVGLLLGESPWSPLFGEGGYAPRKGRQPRYDLIRRWSR